jgi:hypothetical protein
MTIHSHNVTMALRYTKTIAVATMTIQSSIDHCPSTVTVCSQSFYCTMIEDSQLMTIARSWQ